MCVAVCVCVSGVRFLGPGFKGKKKEPIRFETFPNGVYSEGNYREAGCALPLLFLLFDAGMCMSL